MTRRQRFHINFCYPPVSTSAWASWKGGSRPKLSHPRQAGAEYLCHARHYSRTSPSELASKRGEGSRVYTQLLIPAAALSARMSTEDILSLERDSGLTWAPARYHMTQEKVLQGGGL